MKVLISILFFLIMVNTLFAQITGCTDPLANNYNINAEINDGSCTYNNSSVGVTDSWIMPSVMMETSGLIYFDNSIWTHNDDTDINLYRINPSNVDDFQTFELTGTINTDMEDIAQDEDYIYIGDFGNNVNGNRTDLHVLRVEKTSLLNNFPQIDTIWFSYLLQTDFNPTGSNNTDFDCEALIASSDSLYLFTKEWVSEKTSLYVLPKTPGTYIAEYRANLNVSGLITGAEYIEDKRIIALSGYSSLVQPFIYLLYDFQSDNFFDGNKRKISLNLAFHQVEGITTDDGLNYYISNEKLVQIITINQKIHELNLAPYLENYLNSLCDLPETAGIISGNENVCEGDINVHYQIDPIPNTDEYIWSLPNGIEGSSSTNEILLSFGADAQSDYITVRGVNDCGEGEASSLYIEINPKPETPQIYFDGQFLYSSAAEGNQWYNENGEIENENSQSLFVNEDGYYFCIVNINDCLSDSSNIEHVILTDNIIATNNYHITIFPNPSSGEFFLDYQKNKPVIIEITDIDGKSVYKTTLQSGNYSFTPPIDKGLYLLRIETDNGISNHKIIKE
jgi:hypothetical protein